MPTNGSYLTKEEILRAPDLEVEDVEVPEWAGTVRVQALDAHQKGLLGHEGLRQGAEFIPDADYMQRLAALSIVDANGERLFSEEDIAALGKKSFAAIQRVVEVALRISGLTEDAVAELGKDSESIPNDASSSA